MRAGHRGSQLLTRSPFSPLGPEAPVGPRSPFPPCRREERVLEGRTVFVPVQLNRGLRRRHLPSPQGELIDPRPSLSTQQKNKVPTRLLQTQRGHKPSAGTHPSQRLSKANGDALARSGRQPSIPAAAQKGRTAPGAARAAIQQAQARGPCVRPRSLARRMGSGSTRAGGSIQQPPQVLRCCGPVQYRAMEPNIIACLLAMEAEALPLSQEDPAWPEETKREDKASHC